MLFVVEQDGVGMVLKPFFKILDDRRQYSSSHSYQYSTLEIMMRAEAKKGPLENIFSSDGRTGGVARNLCKNRFLK